MTDLIDSTHPSDEPTLPDSIPPLAQQVEERLAQLDADIEAAYQRGFVAGQDHAEAGLLSQVEHYRMLCNAYDEEVKRLRGKLSK